MSRWRSVALPGEHGGWSLTAEPVVLALLVAWSWSGSALGLAAVLAFVARTSLKVVLVDRWRGRWLGRTALAARIAAVEVAVIVALGVTATVGSANPWFWVPLAVAVPLIGLELWFDMRSRSRRLIPELAGTIGIGSVAAAIALVADGGAGLAAGVWSIVAARALAAIPFVRHQLDRVHGRSANRWHSDGAQALAVVVAALAWLVGWIPPAPVVAMAVIAAAGVVAIRRPPQPAVVIGVQQMVVGLFLVVVSAWAIGLG